MGYINETKEEIISSGVSKTPEYARKKADEYRKTAQINYALYKQTSIKNEKAKYYAASQTAYGKSEAW